jgi:hypothetical protein
VNEARSSPKRLTFFGCAAPEYGAAGRAKIAAVMGHAVDTLNLRDILVAEPHRVWFASRALLRRPLLRGCGQRRAHERETEKRCKAVTGRTRISILEPSSIQSASQPSCARAWRIGLPA